MTGPEGAERLSKDWLASVQSNLKACVIEGCSVLFKHNFEVEVRAVMPENGEASARFSCADIVGLLTMKGLALYRMKDKDSYDIYAVAGFYGGGPKEASRAFVKKRTEKGLEKVTLDSLKEIREVFKSPTAQGPTAVARFIGLEDARVDSYRRVNMFLEQLR